MWTKYGLTTYIRSMPSIKFYVQSKNNPAGIYVRLREGVQIDAKAKTIYSINPSNWSAVKGQPKNLKDESFKKLNASLEKFRNKLLNHFNDCVEKEPINSEWLKDFISPKPQLNEAPTKLLDYCDYYAIQKRNELSPSTNKKLKVNKELLKRFQKEMKREYFIKDVDSRFKLEFEDYCKRDGYAVNTIARAMKFIKTLCFHARTKKIETSSELDSLEIKYEKVDSIYLTVDEIKMIEETIFESEYLENARDWLLISCETGQRVSDFLRFTKGAIRYENGKPLIEFTQVKTGKIMTIPLSKRVLKILAKRNDNFPRKISSQKYNDYIKEVCKIAGLTQKIKGSRKDPKTERKETGVFEKWQLVSSHIGRRSFASNYYGIIPTALLIGATGHSTEKLFLEYIGKSDSTMAKQLAEYF